MIAAAVIYIDPFFHYHGPLEYFPYQVDNQLSQNPGMARNMEYDSILLGSSMTVNFESDWFMEDFGERLQKLNYNGAYPRDIKNIMEQCDESGRDISHIYIGVDLASYSGGTDETKYPIPEYLYNKDILDDVNYWYNKDVLLDYVLKPVVEREPLNLSHIYSSEEQLSGCYSREYVLSHYTIPEDNEAWFPDDIFIDGLYANLEENILPIIRSHPGTKFTLFFPPYSVLYFYEYKQYHQLPAVFREYREFIETMLKEPNVEIYFFLNAEDIVTDLDLYADAGHYKQDINHYMEQCFQSGKHRLTKDNYSQTLAQWESLLNNYDYEALLYGDGN